MLVKKIKPAIKKTFKHLLSPFFLGNLLYNKKLFDQYQSIYRVIFVLWKTSMLSCIELQLSVFEVEYNFKIYSYITIL